MGRYRGGRGASAERRKKEEEEKDRGECCLESDTRSLMMIASILMSVGQWSISQH